MEAIWAVKDQFAATKESTQLPPFEFLVHPLFAASLQFVALLSPRSQPHPHHSLLTSTIANTSGVGGSGGKPCEGANGGS